MLDRLIEFSVRNKWGVIVCTLLLCGVGLLAFQELPIDAVPDITNIQVQVNTPVEGLAPEEIERSITFPIENALRGVPFVEDMRSLSRFGLSQVTVNFHEGADIYQARQLVSERLQTVLGQLPPDARPQLGPVTTGLGEIFHYTLEAKQVQSEEARVRQLMEIRTLQEWFVKPRLMTVSGVAEVNTIGGHAKEFYVQPDPQKLAKFGVHIEDLIAAIQRNNNNTGGGYVRRETDQFLVQAAGLFKTPEEILKTPVKTLESLKTVLIGDIASVGPDLELRTGAALVNGREAVVGSPMMRIGENSRVVARRVEEKLKEIAKDLPSEYVLRPLYNRSELVNATLSTMTRNLAYGAALVIVVLLLMVGNLRAALITAAVIPTTLLVTFIFMKRWGVSGNLMSLGALDFGILIDGTVIVVDHVLRRLRDHSSRGEVMGAIELENLIIRAAQEIRTAAGFGELVILVAFLPIFALTGTEGKMFTPMAVVFCIALATAFVLSFTLVPALAAVILNGTVRDDRSRFMKGIETLFARAQDLYFARSPLVLICALFAALCVPFLFSRLGGEFLPQLDEGHMVIQTLRATNISLEESIRLQEKTDRIIENFPEVQEVFTRIGTGEIATDPMGVNLADGFVMLRPRNEWPRAGQVASTKEALGERIVEALKKELPDQSYLVTQPIQMRFNDLLEGTRADVSLKIFGPNLQDLIRVGQQSKEALESLPNAGEVEIDLRESSPILTVVPKTDVLNRLGVPKSDVLEAVSTYMGGTPVGFLFDGVRRFPLVVRLGWNERNELSQMSNIPVGVGQNLTVPMGDLADISMKESYSTIIRENAERRVAVLMNPQTRDLESFTAQARQTIAEKITLPKGVYLEWAGNFKNLERASKRLKILLPITFLLIFFMVYFVFRNWIETFLIFLCIPMGVLGGVISLLLLKIPFSISAAVGFVALSGIAVLNGVVLVSYFNQLKKEGLTAERLVREGTFLRLRPVLMTAVVDVIGFLPMMFASGLGSELQRPLAAVVIGGLLSSTALTLIALPLIYMKVERYLKPA